MIPFLQEVVQSIHRKQGHFENLVFVLPSKRAGLFLKQYVTQCIHEPIISPIVYSIEELIIEISELESALNFELLLLLYEAFQPHLDSKEADFESFIIWGNTLLSDFNEIDRNLVPHNALFEYLTANQRLKNWGADKNATPLMTNTLKFWGHLNTVYECFQNKLLSLGIGHQGLLYRKAVANVDAYISNNMENNYHFIGFNALNTAEEHIFQSFHTHATSSFWWDVDTYFLNDPIHEAGFFIRDYLKRWASSNKLIETNNTFTSSKEIKIIGVPKSISQAKYSGTLLQELLKESPENDIAVVLSDETLLKPILNSLPPNASRVNVTMGLPLQKTGLSSFFEALFDLYLNKTHQGWFYKDVANVLSHPVSTHITNSLGDLEALELNRFIKEKNTLFIDNHVLSNDHFSESGYLKLLFSKNTLNGQSFITLCQNLITQLIGSYQESNSPLELHSLYGFIQLFNQMERYVGAKTYLNSLKAVRHLFNELVATEQIDFRGEPLGGLQVMGVLESRNLDFKTIVLTSVNEGILPAGKSQNSFIPFDIKKEFGLPTYKEKDAIYAYHFYRLLQQAKNIHILYNTEPDVLQGNEKSRFISQLLTDTTIAGNITHEIAAPPISIDIPQPRSVKKTPILVQQLLEKAARGFSPSALTNYIKNPYGFYVNNILGLNDVEDVEENIAHNTFGTIVHDSLEQLYTPLIDQVLHFDNINPLKEKVDFIIRQNFEKFFLPRDIEKGQNLIAYHVIQKYILNFIDFDISRTKNHEIHLLGLEKSLKTKITIPGYSNPVFLKGKLDRTEKIDGTLQILDYKTGNVTPSEVQLMSLQESISSEKRSKAFQLLCYALMEQKKGNSESLLAGIVPIKKISSGILLFAQKESPRGSKNYSIDSELLLQFEVHLASLILEILNPEIPFAETESISF